MSELKGLLIGRNPINTVTGNGKTLATFFAQFEKNNLSQIYVSDLPTDNDICGTFLHISELAVLKTVCGKREVVNTRVETNSSESVNSPGASHTILKKMMRSKAGIWIRNYIWQKMLWVSPTIVDFMQKQNPSFIFYDVGNLSFEYEIATKLANHYDVPLVLYVSDDYIYTSERITPRRQKVIDSYEKMANRASLIIVISEAMKQKYSHHVSSNYVVAMNGCDSAYSYSDCSFDYSNVKAVYTGNVGLGRFETLLKVAEALSQMSQQSMLSVYSSFAINPAQVKKSENVKTLVYCGAVFGEELNKVWDNANLLIYVESFDPKYRGILETAISTKVAEYMLAGRPIVVVAPEYSASARFIDQHKAGLVISTNSISEIVTRLMDSFENACELRTYAINAKEYATRNLTKSKVSQCVQTEIAKECMSWQANSNDEYNTL